MGVKLKLKVLTYLRDFWEWRQILSKRGLMPLHLPFPINAPLTVDDNERNEMAAKDHHHQ